MKLTDYIKTEEEKETNGLLGCLECGFDHAEKLFAVCHNSNNYAPCVSVVDTSYFTENGFFTTEEETFVKIMSLEVGGTCEYHSPMGAEVTFTRIN